MVNTNQTHSASGDNVGQDKNTFNQSGKIGIGDNQGIISGNAKIAGQYNEAPKVNVNVHVNVGEGNNNNGKCDQPRITETSTVLEKVEAFLILTGTLSADNPIELEKQKRKIKAVIEHLNKEFDLDLSIEDITQGSIKIRLSGSEKDINKLQELFESGELQDILDVPVEDVYLVEEEKEHKAKIEAKNRLIEEIKIQGAIDRNLRGVNLSGAYLSGAYLRGAYLSETNLSWANLSWADVINANLSEANLKWANLSWAYLINTNLRSAYLRSAYLFRANMKEANLIGANLSVANLRGADLSGANLRGADLSGADLFMANLSGANLRGADLREADLREADLSGANLSEADLREADLREADLSGADVRNAWFNDSIGIDENIKQDLIKRGAIFEDSPGDRSSVLVPR